MNVFVSMATALTDVTHASSSSSPTLASSFKHTRRLGQRRAMALVIVLILHTLTLADVP